MDYFFAQTLTDICQHSLVFPERPLRCIIIVNPAAGGFNIRSKWESRVHTLKEYRQKMNSNPTRQIYKNIILNITEGKGSASEITKSFIGRAIKDPLPFYLIISAGGDGTHGEVMNAVYNAPVDVRKELAVLRLPMGTGNDGADYSNLADALDLLLKPSHVEYTPAVQLITAPKGPTSWKGPFLAFNICSIGLDAYVVHQTNEMKRNKPGDSYKFWVDMAAMNYDKKYKVDLTEIKVVDVNNNGVQSLTEKILLLAMGVTGNRTYGAQQHILPDNRNVCVIKQMPFLRKLAVKGHVANGTHINSSEALFFNAQRMEIMAKHPILAQMDGETILLKPDDFPIKMELTTPMIPLLKSGLAKGREN
ncbi:MAG: diacylglycerol kinase [Treponema sp.]|jgi:diacylglycerol kinase family enzyme|nr:diacylglycerol kinase [Treponema sp.]